MGAFQGDTGQKLNTSLKYQGGQIKSTPLCYTNGDHQKILIGDEKFLTTEEKFNSQNESVYACTALKRIRKSLEKWKESNILQ